MDFTALVERLRRERLPSWLVHRARDEERGFERFDWCRDAWNLGEFDGRWHVIRGWGAEQSNEAFASEEAACAALYEHVVATGESGVRTLTLDELPAPARGLVRFVGLEPGEHRAGDWHVLGDAMALRVVETPQGFRVDHPSRMPPTVGETWFTGLALDDVARVVLIVAGARLPTRVGVQRWGIPEHSRRQAERGLERLRDISLERIAEAYLGAPEGVLEPLGVPPALDLLTDGLVALAEAQGYDLDAGGGPDAVFFGSPTEGGWALSRVDGAVAVLRRGERSNEWREVGRYAEVAHARRALVAALGLPRG